ncbi:MAG TPA: Rieske (2Fe-2S) protein [Thermoanaerobaculia bacterium]
MPDNAKRPDPALTRRRFCQVTGAAACTAAAGGAAALSAEFLRPRVLFEPPTAFAAGAPEAMDVGQVFVNETYHAYVIRLGDGFRAFSSVCTHLGCITRYLPGERIIACPCHGSRFGLDGEVLAGPAPRPLPSFQLAVSPQGEIEVDTALVVPDGTTFKL